MSTVIGAVVSLLLGALIGAVIMIRVVVRYYSNPEHAKTLLKTMYRKAHPHWLQRSETDTTRVCPCCGWNETEGLISEQPCTHGNPA